MIDNYERSLYHEYIECISDLYGGHRKKNTLKAEQVTGKLPPTPTPKGCREYDFGDYKCIASSQKVADTKYKKFLKSLNK